MFLEPNNIRPGTIVEWLNCPVIVLGVPGSHPRCYAPAAYLRLPVGRSPFDYALGEVLKFECTHKTLWEGQLTDEEEALAMRLLLIGE